MAVAKAGSYKIVNIDWEVMFVDKLIANKIQKGIDNILTWIKKLGYTYEVTSNVLADTIEGRNPYNKVIKMNFVKVKTGEQKTLVFKTVENELTQIVLHTIDGEQCFSDNSNDDNHCGTITEFMDSYKQFV